MHFQPRVPTITARELPFVDYCALNTTSEEEMQRSMDFFGLVINTEKSDVMHQPPPKTAHNASQISVNGTQLQVLSPSHPEAKLAGPNPRRRCAGTDEILSTYIMVRQLQLRWSGHLVRMDDERLPKRLFSETSRRALAVKEAKFAVIRIP
ncbi:hypothetical protein SprV_1002836900 [Sparganum proliferum]